jgi:hypothetical protein
MTVEELALHGKLEFGWYHDAFVPLETRAFFMQKSVCKYIVNNPGGMIS